MERYRYIDLLLTMRSEFMKTKPARDQILDNVKFYPNSFSRGIALSKLNKYGVGVELHIPEKRYSEILEKIDPFKPEIKIVIAEKKYANKKFNGNKVEFKIKKSNINKTITPLYEIVNTTKSLYDPTFRLDEEINGALIDPLLELDLLKLKIFESKNINAEDDFAIIRYCLDSIELFMEIEIIGSLFKWVLRYNMFSDQLILERHPKFPNDPKYVNDFKDEVLYQNDDIPINYGGRLERKIIPEEYREYLYKILTTTIKGDDVPNDWREYLDKHLIVAEGTSFDIMPKLKKQAFAYKVETDGNKVYFNYNKRYNGKG